MEARLGRGGLSPGSLREGARRPQAASEAWARVPPSSWFARRAIRARLDLEIENGRLADAERLINELMADPRADEVGLLELLVPIYSIEGRLEELVRLIEATWDHLNAKGGGASAAAMTLVRVHIGLPGSLTPVEAIRSFLDRAARLAPEDDRIWLGKANLALRVGSFDEAARWLEACLPRRPQDIPVWRARANWAMATGRIAEAREALAHLPAEASTPAEIHRVTAWVITYRKDVAMKRRDLERMIADDPTDFTSFNRLAQLEVQEGHPARHRTPPREGQDRRAPGSIPETLSTESTEPRRGGDGPPGGTTRLLVRGQGLLELGHWDGSGTRRPAEGSRPGQPSCQDRETGGANLGCGVRR